MKKEDLFGGCVAGCLFLRPVDQIEVGGSACEGRVEPSEIGFRIGVVGDISLININFVPLSSLRLMAGHGVSVFDM